MIAQVQVVGVDDPQGAKLRLFEHRDELLALANEQDPVLVRFGGGARDIEIRVIEGPKGTHVVLHLLVNVGDAMGANAVNTMAEALAPRVAEIARGRVLLRILSNKADRRLARARAIFDADKLGGRDVVAAILDSYQLAADDPYRAATHNKGIMNGISAVVLATGNDTRAVEAGCHSHAVRDGRYSTLSHMEKRRRRQPRRHPRAADARRPDRRRHEDPPDRARRGAAPRRRDRERARPGDRRRRTGAEHGRRPRARDRRHPARAHDACTRATSPSPPARTATRSMRSCRRSSPRARSARIAPRPCSPTCARASRCDHRAPRRRDSSQALRNVPRGSWRSSSSRKSGSRS